MICRNAALEDLDDLHDLYESAKAFMHANGNPNQWNDGHPNTADLKQDIEENCLFVLEEEGIIHACFKLKEGIDPTYGYINKGNWLNDLPYAAIHRVATRRLKKGIGSMIMETCKTMYPNLKVDTHYDNLPMQRLIVKSGFKRCGEIYLANGDPRIAYQYCNNDFKNMG